DRQFYAHNELIARRRVPRDPHDWPPVALAMTLQAGILTGDHDFLGCGCPTWTVETLREELDAPYVVTNAQPPRTDARIATESYRIIQSRRLHRTWSPVRL